ncbi:hypothetical protein AV656_02290 [Bhargavaea cecembensis]|uniref:Prepilin-type N-terminal cleavage/methylation domain-containing protein n=1 Tax=Bhargavaea cecembensis TaxID=394098 RepID=A0A161R9W1_9BACL|nr:hypothetical protein [Bhargavaea cecembensis]KZE40125.1 hypothetical protein AV656_02290 [Bhargavaea cecembensis]
MVRSPSRTHNLSYGFTYTEMLLVLAVVMAVTGLGYAVSASKTLQNTEPIPFQEQLKLDIQAIQTHALANGEYTKIVFLPDGTYVASGAGGAVLFRRRLPDGVSLAGFSTLKQVEFTSLGSARAFGTLHFHTPDGDTRVIVHIGKGRVTIVR